MTQSVAAALVRGNIGWMLAVARRFLNDPAKAEDAVQAAFAKILEKHAGFEGRSDIKTWMHRIVVNEALMILRHMRRRNEVAIDDLLPDFDVLGCRLSSETRPEQSPDNILQSAQTRAIVASKIAALPDQYRIVLVHRDIEGLTTSDVAQVLEISEGNVKIRLHRARSALKTLLDPYMIGGRI